MRTLRTALLALLTSACGFDTAGSPDLVPDAPVIPDAPVVPVTCGNHVVDSGEECDDGNAITGDGCAACLIEPAWQCSSGSCVRVVSLSFSLREALASAGTSGGGGVFTHACAAGAAIVGVDGDDSNGITDIGHMRAGCSPLSFGPDGRIVSSVVQTTPYEGGEMAGALGISRCATDSVVVGYVANAGAYLSGLRLICMQVSFVHGALAYGAPVTLPMFGPATGVLQAATQCAAGEATTVFEGKAGAVFDHFDLKCSAMTPVTQ